MLLDCGLWIVDCGLWIVDYGLWIIVNVHDLDHHVDHVGAVGVGQGGCQEAGSETRSMHHQVWISRMVRDWNWGFENWDRMMTAAIRIEPSFLDPASATTTATATATVTSHAWSHRSHDDSLCKHVSISSLIDHGREGYLCTMAVCLARHLRAGKMHTVAVSRFLFAVSSCLWIRWSMDERRCVYRPYRSGEVATRYVSGNVNSAVVVRGIRQKADSGSPIGPCQLPCRSIAVDIKSNCCNTNTRHRRNLRGTRQLSSGALSLLSVVGGTVANQYRKQHSHQRSFRLLRQR